MRDGTHGVSIRIAIRIATTDPNRPHRLLRRFDISVPQPLCPRIRVALSQSTTIEDGGWGAATSACVAS